MEDKKKKESFPFEEFIKITDENAIHQWDVYSSAMEIAAQEAYCSKYKDAPFSRNIYREGFACGFAKSRLPLPDNAVPNNCISSFLSMWEENLQKYRERKLYELQEKDLRYRTDGHFILTTDNFGEDDVPWEKLNEYIKKESKEGIYSDIMPSYDNMFNRETDDLRAYVEKKQRETAVCITRKLILKRCFMHANEIVNCIGLTKEEADLLIEECEIRKQIDKKLREIYLSKIVRGIAQWIDNSIKEKKKYGEVACLAGISLESVMEWEKNPEKQMVFEAYRHQLCAGTISYRFGISLEHSEQYLNECENVEAWRNVCAAVKELEVPEWFYTEMYQKHLKLPLQ